MAQKWGQNIRRCATLAALVSLGLALAACGTPVEVERMDAHVVQTELTSNALTAGRLSESTRIVLRQLDFIDAYAANPPIAISSLNLILSTDTGNRDLLFALAEMTFLEAESSNDRSYFLSTVIYSYAFLFPTSHAKRPNPFDPRLRIAADLYNRALTRGLATADGVYVDLRAADYTLPNGRLSISFDRNALSWEGFELSHFVSAADLRIKGLQNRYRTAGIGAPLAADLDLIGNPRDFQVARRLKIPATLLLQIDISPAAIVSGQFKGTLVLFPGNDERTVEIAGQQVPLEIEPSAALAFGLSNPDIWKTELAGFFQGNLFDQLPAQLVALEPYRPGRIPVVLIHGTASSAGRWADLVNDLENDPAIRTRFQFWMFSYNTGNPVPLSALRLRTDLEAAVSKLDPYRRDPALRNMVLVGHSQGGLLAKMLVINAGSRLYDVFSARPLDELTLTDASRETLREALFVTALPDVTRVIFVATPQRGSFVAGHSLAQLVGRLVTLPLTVTRLAAEALIDNGEAMRIDSKNVRIGSVYGMTPGSPFSNAIASIPVASTVTAHSIVAVTGNGPVESGDDGVVKYSSAHIDEAASELVIRSEHSVQSNPQAVAEVRRILLLQWRSACAQGCLLNDATPVSERVHPPEIVTQHPAPARR
jgi:pimeloyl-ACP methyl ester carboxylesterase